MLSVSSLCSSLLNALRRRTRASGRAGLLSHGLMPGIALAAALALSTPAGLSSGASKPGSVSGASTRDARLGLEPPPIAREFRGVWVASVANIDWPSKRTLSTAEQQAELLALLDKAAELKLNAVIFQVRPAADALYESSLEPWSEYLTGTQGRRPDPYWDPLAFAVREAHARGMELHAWFNPYRARYNDARSPLAASHIAKTNPSLVKSYGGYLWMDPGEPAVRERTLDVVLDVVKRYDIDGVHIDDYFYPYPVNDRRGRQIDFPDSASWRKYQRAGGKLSRGDWRRENVNSLVRELNLGIHAEKPWVQFGVSPFGIWRPGNPAQVTGFDAYEKLYADARLWLREGWVDYLTPQLYWPTTKHEQAYGALLNWWSGENLKHRNLWPGNFTSRAGARGSGSFPVAELVKQVRVTRVGAPGGPRAAAGGSGNVHFSMKAFLDNQAGMNDSLLASVYANVALPPASPWLSAPDAGNPIIEVQRDGALWRLGMSARAANTSVTPWQWLLQLRTDSAWVSVVLPGNSNQWTVPPDLDADRVALTPIDRVGRAGSTLTEPLSNTGLFHDH